MLTLSYFKDHLRISQDDTSEDAFLQSLVQISTEYVTDITGIPNTESAPNNYRAVSALLAAHLYQNREILVDNQITTVPYAFSMLLTNLRPAAGLI